MSVDHGLASCVTARRCDAFATRVDAARRARRAICTMPSYRAGPYDIFVDSAAPSIPPAATFSRRVNPFQVNDLLDRAAAGIARASVLLCERTPRFETNRIDRHRMVGALMR
jgi:hypothetical protein